MSSRDGNDEIYATDANGANVTRITSDPARDRMPTWSADEREILILVGS